MAKHVIHISESDAARDFATLLSRVQAGAEVVIEHDTRPVAVILAAEPVRRTVSECIAIAKAHEEESGRAPMFDEEFPDDMKEILIRRKTWNPPAWD